MKTIRRLTSMTDFYNDWIELMTQSQKEANRIIEELDLQRKILSEISRDLAESNEELVRIAKNIKKLDLQFCCHLKKIKKEEERLIMLISRRGSALG